MNIRFAVLLAGVVWFAGSETFAQEKKPPKVTYDEHVKPVLRQKCFRCHNTDRKRGGLDLSSYTSLMEGGSSGKVIVPGDSAKSYLYKLITHKEEPYMPPRSPKLPDKMLETVRGWIDGGVLENAGSKAILAKKKNIDLTLKVASTARPKEPAMPGRLSLEPITRTERTTAASALTTSPWAPLAAIAGENQILLYNTKTLDLLGVLPFPEGKPQVLKFSRNGDLLLAGGGRGGSKGLAVVWNVKTGKRVLSVGDELDTVLAADISADHRLIALGGPQRVVRVYQTIDGRLVHELRKHTEWIYSVAFSPDGVLLATSDRNGGMFVWEAFTGREYLNLKGHSKAVNAVSWRADSNILASGSEDGTIRLWEMERGRQVRSWGAHGGVADLEFARDGRILSCGRDRTTRLWDQNGKQQRAFSALSDLALRVTFCDETNRAIAGDWNGTIRVWDAAKGTQLGELSSNPPKLAERLETAKKQLTQAQAKHKTLETAYQAAQTALNNANTNLANARKALGTAQKQSKSAAVTLASSKQALAQATAAHKAATQKVVKLQATLKQAQDALAKAQAAAKQAKDNKQLQAQVVAASDLVTKHQAQLAQQQKAQADQAARVEAAKKQLAVAQKQAATAAAAVQANQKLIARWTPTIKPLAEKAASARKARDAAAQALAQAKQQVARWQSEIALAAKTRNTTAKK